MSSLWAKYECRQKYPKQLVAQKQLVCISTKQLGELKYKLFAFNLSRLLFVWKFFPNRSRVPYVSSPRQFSKLAFASHWLRGAAISSKGEEVWLDHKTPKAKSGSVWRFINLRENIGWRGKPELLNLLSVCPKINQVGGDLSSITYNSDCKLITCSEKDLE